MSTPKLKPCPFCGTDPEYFGPFKFDDTSMCRVMCGVCGVEMTDWEHQFVDELWNRRTEKKSK